MYGVVMGACAGGNAGAAILFNFVAVKPRRRSAVVRAGVLATTTAWMLVPAVLNPVSMSVFAFIAGFTVCVINLVLATVMQLIIPQDMRGRLFGLLGTVSGALVPLAMITSGALAEFLPLRPLIAVSFAMSGVVALPLLFSRGFGDFINTAGEQGEAPPS